MKLKTPSGHFDPNQKCRVFTFVQYIIDSNALVTLPNVKDIQGHEGNHDPFPQTLDYNDFVNFCFHEKTFGKRENAVNKHFFLVLFPQITNSTFYFCFIICKSFQNGQAHILLYGKG